MDLNMKYHIIYYHHFLSNYTDRMQYLVSAAGMKNWQRNLNYPFHNKSIISEE